MNQREFLSLPSMTPQKRLSLSPYAPKAGFPLNSPSDAFCRGKWQHLSLPSLPLRIWPLFRGESPPLRILTMLPFPLHASPPPSLEQTHGWAGVLNGKWPMLSLCTKTTSIHPPTNQPICRSSFLFLPFLKNHDGRRQGLERC